MEMHQGVNKVEVAKLAREYTKLLRSNLPSFGVSEVSCTVSTEPTNPLHLAAAQRVADWINETSPFEFSDYDAVVIPSDRGISIDLSPNEIGLADKGRFAAPASWGCYK